MSTETQERVKFDLKIPPKYSIVFYNNDITTYTQVIYLLINAFNMSTENADKITEKINSSEKGVVFISTREVCEAKNEIVKKLRDGIKEEHLKHEIEPCDEI